MLKLVYAEIFMLFGPSDRKLSHFQNLAFPINCNGISCCSEMFNLSKKYISIQNKVTCNRTV